MDAIETMDNVDDADDGNLLRRYVQEHSQPAFAELLRRHLPLVYAAARREIRDAHLAEDVTQAVFLVLARRAEGLKKTGSLAGWLFRTTRYAATSAKAKERRRKHHERQAGESRPTMQPSQTETLEQIEKTWTEIEPNLNVALARLPSKDREAILLRYFEDRSVKEVADALGISEAATKMRIGRGLEKLRGLLGGEAGMPSVAALATVLEAKAIVTVPAGLAGSVTAAVFSGAAATSQAMLIAKGAMNMMTWAKMKLGLVVGVTALVLGVLGVLLTRSPMVQGQEQPTTGAAAMAPKETDDHPADVQQVLAAAKNAQGRFPKQYRAIFWGSEDSIDVVYRQGDKVRMSHYFNLSPSPARPDAKPLGLPATAEQVLQWSQKQTAVEIFLIDGQRDYSRRNPVPGFADQPPGPTVRISGARPYAQNLLPSDNKIEDVQWPFTNRGRAAELLPESSETPAGCIGVRFGTDIKRFDYYVDPKKDYICTKWTWWEKREGGWQKSREYRFEDLRQIEQTSIWCTGTEAVEDYGDEANASPLIRGSGTSTSKCSRMMSIRRGYSTELK